jgi:chitodextrinase
VQTGVTGTTATITGLTCATAYSFTVKAKDAAGNVSAPSNTASISTKACNVLVTNIIYDDVTGSDWSDASLSSVRNFSNTSIVKVGSKSIKVDYSGNGTLAFTKGTALTTAANTELRFWVYNTSKNGIKIYTESANGAKSLEVYLKPAANRWAEVIINRTQLGSPASIKKVVIQNNATRTATMYYDQIQITNVSEAVNASSSVITNRGSVSGAYTISSSNLNLYPNPAKGFLVIQFGSGSSVSGLVTIVDNNGRAMFSQQINLQRGNNQLRITLPKMAPGIYYLKLNASGVQYVKTFAVN